MGSCMPLPLAVYLVIPARNTKLDLHVKLPAIWLSTPNSQSQAE